MSVDAIKEILKKEEGYRRFVYKDSRNFSTIGYGLCIEDGVGEGLSEPDADYLLGMSIRRRIASLEKVLGFWCRLPETAQVVLVCMAYQVGVGGLLGFRDFLEALAEGDWQRAYKEMLDSAWARQTPARANRMAEMILRLANN